jgi:hypothetical protein
MSSRFGLRSRMAVPYVLVSAAAVLVVEAVLLAVMVPGVLSAKDSVEEARQRQAQAETDTARYKVQGLALEIATVAGTEITQVVAKKRGLTPSSPATSTPTPSPS